MNKLFLKVKSTDKKAEMLVPVRVKKGSLNNYGNFGRKDCIITPVGGEGEIKTDYLNLIVK